MAIQEGQITLNEVSLFELDSDPSTGGGFAASIGSIAILGDQVSGAMWIKSGAGDTAWSIIPRLANGTAFTLGSVLFADANGFVAQKNAQFFWDNTNNFLGLGTTVPAVKLHQDGGNATATYHKFTAGTTTGVTSADGFDVGVDAAGNAELRQRENLSMLLYTNNVVGARLDASQRLVISTAASQASSSTDQSRLQVHGTDAATSQAALMRWSNDTASATLRLTKSRGASIGTHTIVQNNDFIGALSFRGSDGANYITAATISALVDGTPAVNGMPARLSLATTPTAGSAAVERMRINAAGQTMFGNSAAIDVTGTSIFPAVQAVGASAAASQYAAFIYSNDNIGPYITLAKSRNTTFGSQTIVAVDDSLGRIQFKGSDGVALQSAAEVRAAVDGTPGVGSMPTRLSMYTTPTGTANPVERVRVDSAGRIVIGAATAAQDITGLSAFPVFQILGTAAVQMAGIQYSADTIGPVFNIIKSRGATVGTQGLVSSGDEFGRIQFRASDGVNFQAGASIRALVDGTAAAGSMPGYLIMMTTPTGATTPVERMRITSTGLAIHSQGIRLGNETDTTDGNARFTSTDFEGRLGSTWRSLTGAWISYNAEATGAITTNSTTDVLMTSMTLTPAAGTYIVNWEADVSATSNTRLITTSIYVDGVQVANSAKQNFIRTGNATFTLADISHSVGSTKVTVNGSQAVELRWKTNGGTAAAQGRNLTLIEVGS